MAKACLRHLLLGAALGAAYPTQAQQRPTPPDTVATRVLVLGADCALFPAAARLPGGVFGAGRPAARFTPTARQAARAEQAVRQLRPSSALVAQTPRDAAACQEVAARLGRYRRQYFGYLNQQRQPCLLLNCVDSTLLKIPAGLPPGVLPNWLAEPVSFSDAGRSYWGIGYNLATGQLFNFWYDLDLGGG